MRWVYPSCAVLITAGVLALCWHACILLGTANAALQSDQVQFRAVLGEVHNAAQSVKESAESSKDYEQYILKHADKSTAIVEAGLVHFTRYTLPAIDGLVGTANRGIQGITGDADKLTGVASADLDGVGGLIQGVTATNAALEARIADPKIGMLEDRINVLALHLDDVSANSDAMSADMKLAVHRLAQPPTKFHQFLNASWTVAKFGSLFIP